MRLRSLASLQKGLFIMALVCIPCMAFLKVSIGQEKKIDALLLGFRQKYRIPEQWTVLPFELEDPYKRVKNGPL